MIYRLIYSLPWSSFILDGIAEVFDAIGNAILDGIKYLIGLMGYLISAAILKLVSLCYSFFRVFAGLTKVEYDGESKYLINVFFDNASINKLYRYMAILGLVLLIAFAIVAVIRKLFDPFEKQKASYGQILMSCGKAILIILLMTAIMNVTLTFTNVLMQRVNYMFTRASSTTPEGKRNFSGEEIAKMNGIMETIGNFAINPSYNSRYNINSCFNAIREPLLELQKAGIFEYQYDAGCWQAVLKDIAKSTSLKKDLMVDVYHESVSNAMIAAMETIKTNANFRPVQSVYSSGVGTTEDVPIDVIIFLSGTAGAAKNDLYNETVSVTDALRGPYYLGKRSIYSLDSVDDDFNIALGGIDYIIIIAVGILVIWQLITCILTCAVRIFNMMLMYIIAPPMAATIPLDDGQRFKSWVDAFIVQSLNVFGTVLIMRLAMLYIPIIMSDKLVLFDSAFMNLVGKAVLIYAGFVAAGRGADLFSGILMGNGAGAAAQAGNMQAQGLAAASVLGAVAEDVSGITKVKDKAQKAYKSMVSQGGALGTAATQTVEAVKDVDKALAKRQSAKDDKKRAAAVANNRVKKPAAGSGTGAGSVAGTGSSGTGTGGNDVAERRAVERRNNEAANDVSAVVDNDNNQIDNNATNLANSVSDNQPDNDDVNNINNNAQEPAANTGASTGNSASTGSTGSGQSRKKSGSSNASTGSSAGSGSTGSGSTGSGSTGSGSTGSGSTGSSSLGSGSVGSGAPAGGGYYGGYGRTMDDLKAEYRNMMRNNDLYKAQENADEEDDEGDLYDEVQSTALGNVLGVHNNLSSQAYKNKRNNSRQKEARRREREAAKWQNNANILRTQNEARYRLKEEERKKQEAEQQVLNENNRDEDDGE